MKKRIYSYVGPAEIIQNLPKKSNRVQVASSRSILDWISNTDQKSEYDDLFMATFIVDTEGTMWINDRRSEHVLCANGKDVLSAGEIGFEITDMSVEVIEVTNQSTGYCPEPESWWAVSEALDKANIQHPSGFTLEMTFRLCKNCGTKNIVKDGWFECGVCQHPLSKDWNFHQND